MKPENEIIEKILNLSDRAEVHYRDKAGNLRTVPGYLIPEMRIDVRHSEPPSVNLATLLDRNQCQYPDKTLEIMVEDIEAIKVLGWRSEKYPLSDVVEVRYNSGDHNGNPVTQLGYLGNKKAALDTLKEGPKPDIKLYSSFYQDNIPQEPLEIEGKDIFWVMELSTLESILEP